MENNAVFKRHTQSNLFKAQLDISFKTEYSICQPL